MEWRVRCDEVIEASGATESQFGIWKDRARVGQVAAWRCKSLTTNSLQ